MALSSAQFPPDSQPVAVQKNTLPPYAACNLPINSRCHSSLMKIINPPNEFEVSKDDPNALIEHLRYLLKNRPENTDTLILHSTPDDIDFLMQAIKRMSKEFLDERVLPLPCVMPTAITESQMMDTMTLAFKLACDLLATASKSSCQWRDHLIHQAIILPQLLDGQETPDNAGLN